MSLVAYGSSDESENEEEINEKPKAEIETQKIQVNTVNKNVKLKLPIPKIEQANNFNDDNLNNHNEQKLNFDVIPKPKLNELQKTDIKEADNLPVPKKIDYGNIEKPPKKVKGPTRILIPSLTDFKDLETENEQNHIKKQPSQKKCGLIGKLPPPMNSPITTKTNLLVPHVLTKKPIEVKKSIKTNNTIVQFRKKIENSDNKKFVTPTLTSLSNYKSDSEDENDKELSSKMDFFSLSATANISDEAVTPITIDEMNDIVVLSPANESNDIEENMLNEDRNTNKMLTSNVINLPKEEILLKNKAEVGPKLPIPEQEYNVDSEGNVAFDDKAIEYLCGKRGVKRKCNELNNVDIIEINGEDIKPDEREWMIKALTDETAQRPISIGAGPSGQSKKKHQITYLAHQAKAMELELKNQWAQNKASRQQTRSKYGF